MVSGMRLGFGNALGASAGRKAGEPERIVKGSDVRRLWRVRDFAFPLLEREYGKVEGGHKAKRMDKCDIPWKGGKATSL